MSKSVVFNANKKLHIAGLKLVFGTKVPWKIVWILYVDLHETVIMSVVLVNINGLRFFSGLLNQDAFGNPGVFIELLL